MTPSVASKPAGLLARARTAIANAIAPAPSARPATGLRRFDAARIDRVNAGWWITNASINQELQGDLDALRARARQLVLNNDYARKFQGMVIDNIVGPQGIVLQSTVEDGPGKPDALASSAIEQAWAEWGMACDVTGRISFVDVCRQLVGGMPSDGEFLVRIVKGADARNRFNLALQLIDVDRIDTTYNGHVESGNVVINGVEVDAVRRPVALWLFEAHPNDGGRSNRTRVRVPMADMIHGFWSERPEQTRGIPWMAPGMQSLHHLGGFMLSALLAAEHGANHYGFFTTPTGDAPPSLVQEPAGNGQAPISVSQPGTFDTLPVGTSFQAFDSRYPSDSFGPFAKTCLQRIASGWRVAYHSLANDLEGVSFSSIRSGTIEERDRWASDQDRFISAFCRPVFQAWLQMALLSGAITMPNGSPLPVGKLAKFARHRWQPRRWDWVDPLKDMEAKVLAVQAGGLSPQALAAAMGADFEDVLRDTQAAQQLAAKYGVTLAAFLPKATAAQGAAPQPTPAAGAA